MNDNLGRIQDPPILSQQHTQINGSPSISQATLNRGDDAVKPQENLFLKIFRYILVAVSLLSVMSVFFDFGVLQLLGSVYYLVTAIFLIKKPKVGYILFAVATLLFFGALLVFRLTANY